jgi:hypothetical protein
MTPPKRPVWPSDDQVRERTGDQEFTDDGRKTTDVDHVGETTPDADPERPPAPRRDPGK